MKKILLIVSLLAGLCISAAAQDVIYTKDGRTIEAKIIEVGSTSISYKKYSNPSGPTYTLPINQIKSLEYENGDNDVFAGRTSTYTKKKYKQLKVLYNPRDYRKVSGEPYNKFWLGFASFIIPGLGEICEGEWGRGLCIVGANVLLSSYGNKLSSQWSSEYQAWYQNQDPSNPNLDTMPALPGGLLLAGAARLGLNIWSIVDARKIAKVKNMYWQDCHGYSSITVSMDPYFAYSPTSAGLQPVTGLSLKLTF